ncbi:MAG TPA: IclR family transcriptional regulator C-terminal domain-containing protein [Acidimicrobiales bacterium]|jgi:IclR family pca regulon transcriptional regulator|nr:IclR family transcriptional regulator C-terminal domain-containing protein [Acidimicrobiales bacterium]
MTETDDTAKPSDFVQSLSRGLEVIRSFGPEHQHLTLSDVARRTGITRAASRRFLLTLQQLGYVRNDGRFFSLTPRVLDLGYAYLSGLSLTEVAQPHVEDLVALTHESSSVAVLDAQDIVYVIRVSTRRIMTATISVGTRFPAWVTSMGRVLLAGLPADDLESYLDRVEIRPLTMRTITTMAELRQVIADVAAQGFATTDQELEDGLRSAAAPIRDPAGRVVAAINSSTHASRVSMEQLHQDVLPAVLEAAGRIETDLALSSGQATDGRRPPAHGPPGPKQTHSR